MIECKKIPFETEEEARAQLEKIVLMNDYRSWKRVSPCRHYFCESCQAYHLTSNKTIIVY
jgi:molybdenum cofactor biosynthesis enzyme MoaA